MAIKDDNLHTTEEKDISIFTLPGLFGLVSLFNGILTFVGYLMPKSFSWKNSSVTI